MRPQPAIRCAALAACLTACLTVTQPADPPAVAPPANAAADHALAEAPAVALLAGATATTVTVDPTEPVPATATAALAAGLCTGDPCSPADPSWTAPTFAVVKDSSGGSADLAAAGPSGPNSSALQLLDRLLPRSNLPDGRTTHPEPGPA